jgi:signal transduction histidine kinase
MQEALRRGYGWPVRDRLRPAGPLSELLLALALTVAIEAELLIHHALGGTGRGAAAALVTLPVALRFRAPLPALLASGAGSLALSALGATEGGDPITAIVALLLVLYAVGSRTSGRLFWASAAAAVVGSCVANIVREGVTPDLATAIAFPAAGLLIGRALGVLSLETDVLERRARSAERERDERAAAAVAQERARMARELHDVIGHSISVMGLQAGAVRRVLPPRLEREREALLAVEQTGRQAVGEMRRLIGLLREDPSGVTGPVPSLRRAEHLVAEMRQAGLPVELQVTGDPAALPPGADLAGYRILQEALTNALKHAPGAHVRASVRTTDGELVVEVLDDGSPSLAATNGHLGHGLLGMRERTALYGGELHAGPRAQGGFGVRARIPLEAP